MASDQPHGLLQPAPAATGRPPADAMSAESLVVSLYQSILNRDPDPGGLAQKLELIAQGSTLEYLIKIMLQSQEYAGRVAQDPWRYGLAAKRAELAAAPRQGSRDDLFPADYLGNAEAGKFYRAYRGTGFLEKFLSGEKVLDVGYKGYENPHLLTVVPHALGVDLDYPGYDGRRLPFEDGSIDAVYTSHCLEHIADYGQAIRDWHRVIKIGGYIVCAVPSKLLYEKKRRPPSKYNGDHKRFYTACSLLGEFQSALEENSYRVRYLEENDRDYDYAIGPDRHASGCYEIVLVVERISKPSWSLEA